MCRGHSQPLLSECGLRLPKFTGVQTYIYVSVRKFIQTCAFAYRGTGPRGRVSESSSLDPHKPLFSLPNAHQPGCEKASPLSLCHRACRSYIKEPHPKPSKSVRDPLSRSAAITPSQDTGGAACWTRPPADRVAANHSSLDAKNREISRSQALMGVARNLLLRGFLHPPETSLPCRS